MKRRRHTENGFTMTVLRDSTLVSNGNRFLELSRIGTIVPGGTIRGGVPWHVSERAGDWTAEEIDWVTKTNANLRAK